MEQKIRYSGFRLIGPLMVVLLLATCVRQPWKQDPEVQAAKRDCAELPQGERYTCIEHHAVESLNPDVCRLAGMWVDDMCLQAVYEIIGKELHIVGSIMSNHEDVRKAIELATSDQADVEAIATHLLPIEDAQRGMELARTKDDGAIKVILSF